MELPTCSPRQNKNYEHQPHLKSFRGKGDVSSSFEYAPHMQSSFPNNRAPKFDSSYHYSHWQMSHIEYITNIKPDDGKY